MSKTNIITISRTFGSNGKGIGKALYDTVYKYAKMRKCGSITLNVWACNESAVKFYEKLGLKMQKIGMETLLEEN